MIASSQQQQQHNSNLKKKSSPRSTEGTAGVIGSGKTMRKSRTSVKSGAGNSTSSPPGTVGSGSTRSRRSNGSGVDHVFQDDNSEDINPFLVTSPKTSQQKQEAQFTSPKNGGSKRLSRTTGGPSGATGSKASPTATASAGREPEELTKFFGVQSARSGIYGASATDNDESTNVKTDSGQVGTLPVTDRLFDRQSRGHVNSSSGKSNKQQGSSSRRSKSTSRGSSRREGSDDAKPESFSLTDRLFDKGFKQRQRERRKAHQLHHPKVKDLSKPSKKKASLGSKLGQAPKTASPFDEITEFSSPVFPSNTDDVDVWEQSSSSEDEDDSDWSDDEDDEEEEVDETNPLVVQGIAAQYARVASRQFDVYFTLDTMEKEKSIPLFYPTEIAVSTAALPPNDANMTSHMQANQSLTKIQPVRALGHYVEYKLKCIQLAMDSVQNGHFDPEMSQARNRFMDRSMDGSYSVKYISPNLLTTPEIGPFAAADLALEIRILSNLPGHPNIAPVYGLMRGGVLNLTKDAATSNDEGDNGSTSSLRNGFFFITDRIQELLPNRIDAWRQKKGYNDDAGSKFSQRLEVALDISSALLFLHDREIVFHIRPDKVGFDAKHAHLKLFNFSEARQDGMKASDQSRFVTKSQDIDTLAYTAPEVLCNAPVTTSSDVYGFGVLLWQLISLKTPFEGMNQQEHFKYVVKEHLRPRISGKWPHEIGKLLESLWDPYLRMTMKKANEELETILLF